MSGRIAGLRLTGLAASDRIVRRRRGVTLLPRHPFLCFAISACSPVAGGDGFLPLAPIDGLLAQAEVTAVDPGPALAARAARLRAQMLALRP